MPDSIEHQTKSHRPCATVAVKRVTYQ